MEETTNKNDYSLMSTIDLTVDQIRNLHYQNT